MKNILLKGIIGLMGISSLGVLSSCDDQLEEVIYSELTNENAFKTKNDAVAAINGIYQPLATLINRGIFYLNDMSTDACYMENGTTEVWNENQMNNQQDVNTSWKGYYNMVTRANISIDNISKISGKAFDANEDEAKGNVVRDKLLGEAYFLRGFAYYMLSDIYYTVPLVLDSNTKVDAILPLASLDEIEAQIEKDLLAAEAVLPKTQDLSEIGRATSGAAKGYLMRLHMRKAGRNRLAGQDASADWQKAKGYADDILALEGDVYSLQAKPWDIYNPFVESCKTNNEFIFAVYSNVGGIGGGASDCGMNFTPWDLDCGWNLFSVPLSLAWEYEVGDFRGPFSQSDHDKVNPEGLLISEWQSIYNNPNAKQNFYLMPKNFDEVGTLYHLDDNGTPEGSDDKVYNELGAVNTWKYRYERPQSYNYSTGNTMSLIRLGDVILCKAEILNELNGPSQEAMNLINRIRERAFQNAEHNYQLADYKTKEAFRELIAHERLLELNNEGVRRPDLIRMGLWKKTMVNYVAFIKKLAEHKEINVQKKNGVEKPDYSAMWKVYPTDLTDDDIRRYYPVPKRESDLNPELLKARTFK